jgi:hypothetical protein
MRAPCPKESFLKSDESMRMRVRSVFVEGTHRVMGTLSRATLRDITVVEKIYNEKVRDMLDMRNTSDLTIHETAGGVMVAGATEVFVSSQEEVRSEWSCRPSIW